jgi:GT2 family glycosyltransferase
MDLSILIISYNTRDMTIACLRSLYEQTRDLAFEVIVVDNASTDGSADTIAEQFPQARLLRPSQNLGFAGANNLAATCAAGRFLLLLNPDTIVLDGAIQKLHAFARAHDEATIFGGRTFFPDGSLNPKSCWRRPTPWSVCCTSLGLSRLFPRSDLFASESYGPWRRDTVREVDVVSGCFLMIRRDVWQALDGFDTGFFMYGEEVDLCWRALKAGHRCLICPDARIVHFGGASERVRADKMVRLFCAKQRLFDKHWDARARRLGTAALNTWALTRMAAFAILRRFDSRWAVSHETWTAIWRRRAEWQADPGIPGGTP